MVLRVRVAVVPPVDGDRLHSPRVGDAVLDRKQLAATVRDATDKAGTLVAAALAIACAALVVAAAALIVALRVRKAAS